MTRNAILFGAAGAVLASSAAAQLSVISVNRYVRVAAEGGFTTDGPRTTNGPIAGPWVGSDFAAAAEGTNGGSADGYQESAIGAGVYSGYLDGRANAFGDGSDFASGYGQAHFEMDFSLAAAGDYTLEGFVNAFGQVNGEVSKAYIEIVDLGTNTAVWSLFVDDSLENFSEAGTLPAGNYRFEADALAIVDRIFESGFGDSTASVEFDLTIVPTPASASLLALGVIGCAGRRRR